MSVIAAQDRVNQAQFYVRKYEQLVTFAGTSREVRQYTSELMAARDELKEAYAALATAKKAAGLMDSSAVGEWGLQVASAGLGRAFPTEVSYGAPIAAAFAVQNAAEAGFFGAGALSGLGSALDGAASSMGGSYGGTSPPSYGGSPAYAAAYDDLGAAGRVSSSYGGRADSGPSYGGSPPFEALYRDPSSGPSYGGSPAFEALYGDSRSAANAQKQKKAQIEANMAQLEVRLAQLNTEAAQLETDKALCGDSRSAAKAQQQKEAQLQAKMTKLAADMAQQQAEMANLAAGDARRQEQARAEAKAQKQKEAEAEAPERARAAAEARAQKRAQKAQEQKRARAVAAPSPTPEPEMVWCEEGRRWRPKSEMVLASNGKWYPKRGLTDRYD